MAWFPWRRRLKRNRLFKPYDTRNLPEPELPTLETAFEDGLLLAEYATRMAVKNRIIVDTIQGGDHFDIDRFLPVAREQYLEMASESEFAADRIEEAVSKAKLREGDARHAHDYRVDDVRPLALRARSSRKLAETLRERADDEEALRDVIEQARADAWRDVRAALNTVLDSVAGIVAWNDDYEAERPARVRRLVDEDLAKLKREVRRRSDAKRDPFARHAAQG
ncbi:hypothetical protein [Ruicaihuangia caeni]|uniref:Asparagine synthase n=1 Tax=Ruicaihuangia caeni TaxID=3042517 RepID=A0AAW6T6Z5_9MICO|nr:hypothetical protein [Klugiella sp. YN-L-19]MDI2099590.1 hypothetical protein [Klugiella sp. YN-L-19]